MDNNNHIKDTGKLQIFIKRITDNFEISEEFLAMQSLKEKTREDLYAEITAVMERLKLSWSKLANVTTDGLPNLAGKNVGPQKDCTIK